jgi:hypothetical protein
MTVLKQLGQLFGSAEPLGTEKKKKKDKKEKKEKKEKEREKEKEDEDEEEEEELEEDIILLPSKRQKKKLDTEEELQTGAGIQPHFLFESEKGYLLLMLNMHHAKAKLKVDENCVTVALESQAPLPNKVAGAAGFHGLFDLAVFNAAWYEQSIHRDRLQTYEVALPKRIETTPALLRKEENEEFTAWYLPFAAAHEEWA